MEELNRDNPYVDLHNHGQASAAADLWQITNLYYQHALDERESGRMYSIGLHPWHSDGVHFNPDLYNQLLARPSIAAAGEIGLDRMKGPDPELQLQLFLDQARAADMVNKPVIIHCVRSWEELMAVKRIAHPKVPWIIHGFRGKRELALSLYSQGFMLSFGSHLLSDRQSTRRAFEVVPTEAIFLETDEADIDIRELYEEAARIRSISLTELRFYMADNFEKTFGTYDPS